VLTAGKRSGGVAVADFYATGFISKTTMSAFSRMYNHGGSTAGHKLLSSSHDSSCYGIGIESNYYLPTQGHPPPPLQYPEQAPPFYQQIDLKFSRFSLWFLSLKVALLFLPIYLLCATR
jgi:hypothetical protein